MKPREIALAAVIAFGLGCVFASHALLFVLNLGQDTALAAWGLYGMANAAFHCLEFAMTAWANSMSLSNDSFLLNHSLEYGVAAFVSWVEFWLQYALFPGWKCHWLVCTLGVLLVVGGQVLRTLAMWTAGRNFTHMIADYKTSGHELVTHGVYRYLRHPSYCGWFYWSVGTQLLLCNPLCFVGYAVVSWRFFRNRIAYEEHTLNQFFPQYAIYASRTLIGIPLLWR